MYRSNAAGREDE